MWKRTQEMWDLSEAEVKIIKDLVISPDWGVLKDLLETVTAGAEGDLRKSNELHSLLRAQGALRLKEAFIANVETIAREAVDEEQTS